MLGGFSDMHHLDGLGSFPGFPEVNMRLEHFDLHDFVGSSESRERTKHLHRSPQDAYRERGDFFFFLRRKTYKDN